MKKAYTDVWSTKVHPNLKPALVFESEEERDRAMEMVEAMEYASEDETMCLAPHAEGRGDAKWEYSCGITECGCDKWAATPWDAILAAKKASER